MINKQNLLRACSEASNPIDLNQIMFECGITDHHSDTFHGEIVGYTEGKPEIKEQYQDGGTHCDRFLASTAAPGTILGEEMVIFSVDTPP